MIEIRVDQLLEAHGRTFYWLAKETGISHTTLWRFEEEKSARDQFRHAGEDVPGAWLPTRRCPHVRQRKEEP